MNEDIWLVAGVAMVWALLALVYALAPWGDMIGYARVWGFGAVLFLGLAVLLRRAVRRSQATAMVVTGADRRS